MYFFFSNLFIFCVISVPEEVHDESAALTQFKTVFSERYFNDKIGPDFSTKSFHEVFDEACKGTNKKPLGSKNEIIYFKM